MKKEDLQHFIYLAKLSSFASGEKPKKYRNGSKEYSFTNGVFRYIDKYFGDIIDHGLEVVHYNNIPVWSMSYRGGMTTTKVSAKECFHFLKKVLLQMPTDFSVRGPSKFVYLDYSYYNHFRGNILDFIGHEEIYLQNSLIYSKKYLGGIFFIPDINGKNKIQNTIKMYTDPNDTKNF